MAVLEKCIPVADRFHQLTQVSSLPRGRPLINLKINLLRVYVLKRGLCFCKSCFLLSVDVFLLLCFQSIPSKDWYDFTPQGSIRSWPSNGVSPDPFHRGEIAALRNVQPNGDSPTMLKVDVAHTYAIQGFGKDELASTLIFLAVHCEAWGPGNIDVQLAAAFQSFEQYLLRSHKTSTIKGFTKEELKIKSTLNCLGVFFFPSTSYRFFLFLSPSKN